MNIQTWVVVYGKGECFFVPSLCNAIRSGAADMRVTRQGGFQGAVMRSSISPRERQQCGICLKHDYTHMLAI